MNYDELMTIVEILPIEDLVKYEPFKEEFDNFIKEKIKDGELNEEFDNYKFTEMLEDFKNSEKFQIIKDDYLNSFEFNKDSLTYINPQKTKLEPGSKTKEIINYLDDLFPTEEDKIAFLTDNAFGYGIFKSNDNIIIEQKGYGYSAINAERLIKFILEHTLFEGVEEFKLNQLDPQGVSELGKEILNMAYFGRGDIEQLKSKLTEWKKNYIDSEILPETLDTIKNSLTKELNQIKQEIQQLSENPIEIDGKKITFEFIEDQNGENNLIVKDEYGNKDFAENTINYYHKMLFTDENKNKEEIQLTKEDYYSLAGVIEQLNERMEEIIELKENIKNLDIEFKNDIEKTEEYVMSDVG